jgi:hypothetical protein
VAWPGCLGGADLRRDQCLGGDVDRKIEAERRLSDEKLASERRLNDEKLKSESSLAQEKLLHEVSMKMTDRAWADYSLRRDIYLDLAKQIDYLFATDTAPEAEKQRREEFLKTTQKVRVIGSDLVVTSLNALTSSIKDQAPPDVSRDKYSALMNAIRHDIRRLNELPAVGTALDPSAFPIES